jgi:hypothetical protein
MGMCRWDAHENLVGVSANERVAIDQDPQAVRCKVAQLSADASIKVYANHGITIGRLKRFADLQPLRQAPAQAFPAARFDLPGRLRTRGWTQNFTKAFHFCG